jgi:carbon-monoxide dehydrogenase medium subunit
MIVLPRFEYKAAGSVAEACRLLRDAGGAGRVMAGGTDLLVKLKSVARPLLPAPPASGEGPSGPELVVGLRGIRELATLGFDSGRGLVVGATACLADVAAHPDVLRHYPAVAYAASETGTPQVRNMGTVVGNLCNAAPSADNAPALLVLGAEVRVAGEGGERVLPLAEFFRGPGETALGLGEIVTAVEVPVPPARSGASYRHLSARGRVDLSAVGTAAFVSLDEEYARVREVRIALGGVAPTPLLVAEAGAHLADAPVGRRVFAEAAALAARAARPISDVRASAGYRRRMVQTLVQRALLEAVVRAQADGEVRS